MRHPDAGLAAVVKFFAIMAQVFRSQPALARRGCLIANTVAELGGRDQLAASAGARYRNRLCEAFAAALNHAAARGEINAERARARAGLLASMTMGLFMTGRHGSIPRMLPTSATVSPPRSRHGS